MAASLLLADRRRPAAAPVGLLCPASRDYRDVRASPVGEGNEEFGAPDAEAAEPSTRWRPNPVFAVVGAGLSLTAALFHAARLGAARRYARTPVAAETLHAHVEALDPGKPGP
jgi:hypothetical protein